MDHHQCEAHSHLLAVNSSDVARRPARTVSWPCVGAPPGHKGVAGSCLGRVTPGEGFAPHRALQRNPRDRYKQRPHRAVPLLPRGARSDVALRRAVGDGRAVGVGGEAVGAEAAGGRAKFGELGVAEGRALAVDGDAVGEVAIDLHADGADAWLVVHVVSVVQSALGR